jgi:hypothetical protein
MYISVAKPILGIAQTIALGCGVFAPLRFYQTAKGKP